MVHTVCICSVIPKKLLQFHVIVQIDNESEVIDK